MNDESNSKQPEAADQPDNDLFAVLKRMQQQLLQLEKKVDLLIGRSQGKGAEGTFPRDRSFQKKSYSKPFSSFSRPPRRGKEEREPKHREKNSASGHFYDRYQHKKGPGKPKNRPSAFKRKDRE